MPIIDEINKKIDGLAERNAKINDNLQRLQEQREAQDVQSAKISEVLQSLQAQNLALGQEMRDIKKRMKEESKASPATGADMERMAQMIAEAVDARMAATTQEITKAVQAARPPVNIKKTMLFSDEQSDRFGRGLLIALVVIVIAAASMPFVAIRTSRINDTADMILWNQTYTAPDKHVGPFTKTEDFDKLYSNEAQYQKSLQEQAQTAAR